MDKITNLSVPILLIEMMLSTGLGTLVLVLFALLMGRFLPAHNQPENRRKQIHLPTRITLYTYIFLGPCRGLQARFAIRVVKRTFDISYSLYSAERLRVLGGLLSTRPVFLACRQKTGRWWTRADAASI